MAVSTGCLKEHNLLNTCFVHWAGDTYIYIYILYKLQLETSHLNKRFVHRVGYIKIRTGHKGFCFKMPRSFYMEFRQVTSCFLSAPNDPMRVVCGACGLTPPQATQ